MEHKDFKLPEIDKEVMSDIEDRLKELKDRTTDFVQKNPITSIAIAAGIGFILAKLLSGRKS